MWPLYVLAIVLVVASMAAGIALGLHLVKPARSEKKRMLVSASIAAFLPMSLAFGGFAFEVPEMIAEGDGETFVLGFTALIVTQILLLATCALPPAWFATTRLAKSKDDSERAVLPKGGESQMLT